MTIWENVHLEIQWSVSFVERLFQLFWPPHNLKGPKVMYYLIIIFLYRYGIDSSSTAIENVYCSTSSYRALTQCSFVSSSLFCNDNSDVIVTCCEFIITDPLIIHKQILKLTKNITFVMNCDKMFQLVCYYFYYFSLVSFHMISYIIILMINVSTFYHSLF